MKRLRHAAVGFVSLLLVMLAEGCRNEEDAMAYSTRKKDDLGDHRKPDFNEQDWPDTEREPPRFPEEFEAPITLPTGYDPAAYGYYATEIKLNAGCENNPPRATVPKEHEAESECDYATAIALRPEGKTLHIVDDAEFLWAVGDPQILELECPKSPYDETCRVVGRADLFDGDEAKEPKTLLAVCAVNHCPEPPPADCLPMVCSSTLVASVVNLEGEWELLSPVAADGAVMRPSQYGREFQDSDMNIKDGRVASDRIDFEIGDYAFTGVIAPNRNHIYGQVYETMTMSFVSDWSAARLEP